MHIKALMEPEVEIGLSFPEEYEYWDLLDAEEAKILSNIVLNGRRYIRVATRSPGKLKEWMR
jgi:hypothetical protein